MSRGLGHTSKAVAGSFPDAVAQVAVKAETIGGMIAALDARWPGMRGRLCDETPRIRPHLSIFCNGARAGLGTPLRDGDGILCAHRHVWRVTALPFCQCLSSRYLRRAFSSMLNAGVVNAGRRCLPCAAFCDFFRLWADFRVSKIPLNISADRGLTKSSTLL